MEWNILCFDVMDMGLEKTLRWIFQNQALHLDLDRRKSIRKVADMFNLRSLTFYDTVIVYHSVQIIVKNLILSSRTLKSVPGIKPIIIINIFKIKN